MTDAAKQIVLDHLVFLAQHDKVYAWYAAKEQARIGECLGWSDLPDLLAERMRARG